MTQQSTQKTILKTDFIKRRLLTTSALTMAGLMAASPAVAGAGDIADLTQASEGVTYSQNGSIGTVDATSTLNSVLYWDTTNTGGDFIGEGAELHINQQTAASRSVNNINSLDGSHVRGLLQSNGIVVLLDKNGVLFHQGAKINVNGILASTGTLDAANLQKLLAGQSFTLSNVDGTPGAKVINEGTVNIADAGLLAFVAPYVSNTGTINAKLGRVSLAAGKKVTVDLTGDDLILIDGGDKLAKAYVENAGAIDAAGGKITMTASAAGEAVNSVVNMSGVTQANSFSTHNGKIVLGSSGNIVVSGTVKADGNNGQIEAKAQNLLATEDSVISADGTGSGNGGGICLIGENVAIFRGSISAKGGEDSGNGGFIETSGYNYLDTLGLKIDTTAANGATGTWLLDPLNILIIGGNGDGHDNSGAAGAGTIGGWTGLGDGGSGTVPYVAPSSDSASPYTIYESEIENQSKTTNIIIQARKSITTDYGKSTDGFVNLAADSNLTIETRNNTTGGENDGIIDLSNLGFATSGAGAISITASTGNGTGNVLLGNLKSETGSITASTDNGYVTLDSSRAISSTTGKISLSAEDDITTNGTITSEGGDVTLAGGTNSDDDTVAVNATINTGGGKFTSTSRGAFSTDAAASIFTEGGDLSITSTNASIFLDKDIETLGGDATFFAGTTFTTDDTDIGGDNLDQVLTAGGNVTITANDIILGNTGTLSDGETTLDAGTGTVTIHRTTGGHINLGSTGKGDLNLSAQEVKSIIASSLNVGGSNTSSMDVTGIDTTKNISGAVNLTVGLQDGDFNDLTFFGKNAFNGLTAVTNDDVALASKATVNSFGDVTFSTDTNSGTVGDFNMGTGSSLTSNGFDVTVNTLAVNLDTGASIDAMGGDILLNNTGIFSGDEDSLNTEDTGTIELNQWEGGSINNAVAALNNTGTGQNTVNVGAGTYAESVLVDQANTDVIGAGTGTTFVTPNSPGFHVTADNVLVTKFTVDGAGSDSTNGYGIWVDNAEDVTLTGNNVINTRLDGIFGEGAHGLTVQGNTIDNVGADNAYEHGNGIATLNSDGVLIGGSGAGEGNTITRASWDGVRIDGGTKVSVIGNDVGDGNTKGINRAGIWLNGTASGTVAGNTVNGTRLEGIGAKLGSDITIEENDVDNTLLAGISASGVNGLMIRDNSVDGAGSNGIQSFTGSNVKILGNSIGTDGGNVTGNSVYIFGTPDAHVSGNTIENATFGIFADQTHGISIFNNDVSGLGSDTGTGITVLNSNDAQVGDSDLYGLVLTKKFPYVSFAKLEDRDNRISSFETGVHIIGGDDNTVKNNTISNVHYGVHLEGTTDALVVDNTLNGNSYVGITVEDGSHGATVTDNDITHFYTGVKVTDSDGVTVKDNTLTDVVNGIVARWSDSLKIISNSLTGRSTKYGTGITVEDSNDVEIGGWDVVTTLGKALFEGNNIRNFENGIYAEDVGGLKIQGNRVDGGSRGTGIKIVDSNGAEIGGFGWLLGAEQGNFVTGFDDGIYSYSSNHAWIVNNRVEDTDEDGIKIRRGHDVYVKLNTVRDAGDHGISADDVRDLTIWNNTVRDADKNGIQVADSRKVRISGNDVRDSGWNGIYSYDSDYVSIADNNVEDSDKDGIKIRKGHDIYVKLNTVEDSGDHGISADGVRDLKIRKNTVKDSGRNGIQVIDSKRVSITRNYVRDSGWNGVFIDPTSFVDVSWNIIKNSGWNGIWGDHVTGLNIAHNWIFNYGNAGVKVTDSDWVRIHKNAIIGNGHFGTAGIRLWSGNFFDPYSGNDHVSITDNFVKNNSVGLDAFGWDNGKIRLDGNTFKNNFFGAQFASGLIDMTGENTFIGGHTALLFSRALNYGWPEIKWSKQGLSFNYPTDLALVDNTIGHTIFEGQSKWYVYLKNGAFFDPGTPTIINGLDAEWDGVPGGLMTSAQLAYIQSRIHDFVDDPTLGLFFPGFTASLDNNDIFRLINGLNYKPGQPIVIILGLPNPNGGGGANFFAGLEPAAGGEGGGTTAEDLANLEPSAGNNTLSVGCWNNVGGALTGGTPVAINLGGEQGEIIAAVAGCTTESPI